MSKPNTVYYESQGIENASDFDNPVQVNVIAAVDSAPTIRCAGEWSGGARRQITRAGTSSADLHIVASAVQDTDTAGRSPGRFRRACWPAAAADSPGYRAGRPAGPLAAAAVDTAGTSVPADMAGTADCMATDSARRRAVDAAQRKRTGCRRTPGGRSSRKGD